MSNALYAELVKESWAMEPRALEAFLKMVAEIKPPNSWGRALSAVKKIGSFDTAGTLFIDELTGEESEAESDKRASFFREATRKSNLTVAGDKANIRISGTLMKRVPNLFRWFGIDATSYAEILADIKDAVANDDVKDINLQIESPGGQVSGLMGLTDALFAFRHRKKDKTFRSTIEDIGASAAFWIASQTETIHATDTNTEIGSIGVYMVIADLSKMAEDQGVKIHVISSGPLKGAGVPGSEITEEQLQSFQEIIDGISNNFVKDVARGRGISVTEAREWATGQVWLAADAKKLGLIDSVMKPKVSTSESGSSAAMDVVQTEGGLDMATKQEQEAAEAREKVRAEAAAEERKRMVELKAAFPNDLEFATAQYESGATVQAAKAAYADVLTEKQTKLEKENAELRKKAEAANAGAPPIKVGEGGGAGDEAGTGFIEQAQALAKKEGWKIRKAMSFLAGKEPELYQKHLDKCADMAPAHHQLKRKLGIK